MTNRAGVNTGDCMHENVYNAHTYPMHIHIPHTLTYTHLHTHTHARTRTHRHSHTHTHRHPLLSLQPQSKTSPCQTKRTSGKAQKKKTNELNSDCSLRQHKMQNEMGVVVAWQERFILFVFILFCLFLLFFFVT